jgi:hypothetical protein
LTATKAWLWIAATAAIPLAAAASSLQTTIVESGAPISIDQCGAVLERAADGSLDYHLSESLDFTNVSQRTAVEVRFAFKIVDPIGRTEHTLVGERLGSFAPGIPVDQPAALRADPNPTGQTIDAVPSGATVLCSVQMVRFDDGSVWHEGDGPAGSAAVFTPAPGPSSTPQWQWQDQTPP